MVEVKNPEISQAFYGELKGRSAEFRIQSGTDFRLYVGVFGSSYSKYPQRHFCGNFSRDAERQSINRFARRSKIRVGAIL